MHSRDPLSVDGAPAAGMLQVGSLSCQPFSIASSVDSHLAKVMPTSTGGGMQEYKGYLAPAPGELSAPRAGGQRGLWTRPKA